jgi:hypothetical protein
MSVRLLIALHKVRELIDGYVDVDDCGNVPVPNNAMRAVQVIDEAIKAYKKEVK